MRIVSDKFIEDLREVLRDSMIVHFDACDTVDGTSYVCTCGADLTEAKLDRLFSALKNDDSFAYTGATH